MSDAMKKLAARVSQSVPRERVTKANRTLSLRDPQFTRIRNYCQWKGVAISEIVDELLAGFAEEIGEDALAMAEDFVSGQARPGAAPTPRTGTKKATDGSDEN